MIRAAIRPQGDKDEQYAFWYVAAADTEPMVVRNYGWPVPMPKLTALSICAAEVDCHTGQGRASGDSG
jgi:hypothetical protein